MVYIDHSLLTKNQSILLQIIQLPVVPCWKNNDYWSMVFTKFSYHNKCLDLKIWISHKLLLGFWMTILILHVCNWNMFHYSKKKIQTDGQICNYQLHFLRISITLSEDYAKFLSFLCLKVSFQQWIWGDGVGAALEHLLWTLKTLIPPMCVICTTIMMLDIRKSVKNDVSTTSC